MTEKGKKESVNILERGDIYFLYRPRVRAASEQKEPPEGVDEVERLYMILSPSQNSKHRLIVIGQKQLPEIEDGGEKYWGFVEKVDQGGKGVEEELGRHTYQTKTRGERVRPAAIPAGEGVHVITTHGNHTHLAYALELPKSPGEVQQAFRIEEEGSYIITIKNPEKSSPSRAGLREQEEADYPKRLQERFRGRRFANADPSDFLDYEGAQLVLIGAKEDVSKELGIQLHPQEESAHTAEIFKDLHIESSKQKTKPLFKGEWAA